MVRTLKVDGGENSGLMKTLEKVLRTGNRIAVRLGKGVNATIVAGYTPIPDNPLCFVL